MPIKIACPKCSAPLIAPDEYAGRAAKCKKCGEQLTLPVQSERLHLPDVVSKRAWFAAFVVVSILASLIGAAAGFLAARAYDPEKAAALAEVDRLSGQLNQSNRSLEKFKSDVAVDLAEYKKNAVKLIGDSANALAAEKVKEYKAITAKQTDEAEIALALAKMSQLERGRFKVALEAMRRGEPLKRSQIDILEMVPAIHDELSASILKQEQGREFKELIGGKPANPQP